jgi:transcriptional regulator of acetoin/glycerol metabolism
VLSVGKTLHPRDLSFFGVGHVGELDQVIRQKVADCYDRNQRSVAATARELGVHRATVYRHVRDLRAERTKGPLS